MIRELLARILRPRQPDTIPAGQVEDRELERDGRRRGSRSYLDRRAAASMMVDDQFRYWAQTKSAKEVRSILESLDE